MSKGEGIFVDYLMSRFREIKKSGTEPKYIRAAVKKKSFSFRFLGLWEPF